MVRLTSRRLILKPVRASHRCLHNLQSADKFVLQTTDLHNYFWNIPIKIMKLVLIFVVGTPSV